MSHQRRRILLISRAPSISGKATALWGWGSQRGRRGDIRAQRSQKEANLHGEKHLGQTEPKDTKLLAGKQDGPPTHLLPSAAAENPEEWGISEVAKGTILPASSSVTPWPWAQTLGLNTHLNQLIHTQISVSTPETMIQWIWRALEYALTRG